MLDPHPVPVRIELFRQDHRDGGVGALAHLDLRHDERDFPLPVDPDEGIRREGRGFGSGADRAQRDGKAEQEGSRG
jgi:hypothetical protein